MLLKGSSVLIVIVALSTLIGVIFAIYAITNSNPGEQTACTLEAMLCPDGSSVGRTGPNCEFAPCPSEAEKDPAGNSNVFKPFTASFEIYTNGTKRIFTAAMYRNLSEDAYIGNSDPSTVYVAEQDITWQEFFDTLPFKLSSDCLTTGTGQTFCTGEPGVLRFFLNSEEIPNALSQHISSGDKLVVRYE